MRKHLLILVLIFFGVVTSLSLRAQEIYKVNAERLNIRKDLGNHSKPYGYILKGELVTIIDKSNPDWFKVRLKNGEGYVSSKYLEFVRKKDIKAPSEITDSNFFKSNKFVVLSLALIVLGIFLFAKYSTDKKTQEKHNFEFVDGKEFQSFTTNTAINTTPNQTIIIKSKSIGLAIILTFLFGPFGMIYSTLWGAITMLIIVPIVSFFILFVLNLAESPTLLVLY